MITPDVAVNDSEVRLCHRIIGADVWRSVDEDLGTKRLGHDSARIARAGVHDGRHRLVSLTYRRIGLRSSWRTVGEP
jgi:hypothetical protein